MTTIEFLKNWLIESKLMVDFNQSYDFIEQKPNESGLYSNGAVIVSEDIIGNKVYRENFTLYSGMQAYTDYDRLVNSDFLKKLQYSLNQIKNVEVTEAIDDKEMQGIITSIKSSNGMLYNIPTGDINDGVIYQLQIEMNYKVKGE